MFHYFQIDNLFFFPQKNEIHREAEILKVRPKTAELLSVLLEAKGEIVSKSELLKVVWNDVVVEEHVVFQSITELRKIFADASVIKTHPRKGYSITATINKCVEDVAPTKQTPVTNPYKQFNVGYLIALITILLICLYYFAQNEDALETSGSILVLPVTNHIADADHSWLKYGGMDLLIKHLQPQMKLSVLQTEDVLEIIKRAEVNTQALEPNAISRIFEVSGAELIIEQSLSGSTRDYQLVYSLHKKTKTARGALFSKNVKSLFVDLNTQIFRFTGNEQTEQGHDHHNDFTNKLMATAIDQLQFKNFGKAATLFRAVLVNEPDNVTAYKLLSQVLNNIGNPKETEKVSREGMLLAKKLNNDIELVRIMFWHALSIAQQMKYFEALAILEEAKQKAKNVNDLLYTAHISRVSGKILLSQSKFREAENEFIEALQFHDAIQCPFGRSNTFIDLGELSLQKKNLEQAQAYFNQALELAQRRHLTDTIELAKEWLVKVKQPNLFQSEASSLSNKPVD